MSRGKLSKEVRALIRPSPRAIRMQEEEIKLLEDQEKRLKQQNEEYAKMLRHLQEAHKLKKQALKREAGLKPANATERQKANARHQQIREIAADVVSTEKRPLRMTTGWLADKVRARATKIESLKVRGSVVSPRTIRRALRAAPSKKV
jgi:hypothetical protein